MRQHCVKRVFLQFRCIQSQFQYTHRLLSSIHSWLHIQGKMKTTTKKPSVPTMPASLSDFCGCKSYFLACIYTNRNISVLLILPAPVTQKYICTATQFCIYRSTASAAKAGQRECVDTKRVLHTGNIL